MSYSMAKQLKKWRGKLMQKEAASILGVSLRTYQGWEQGRPLPDLSVVEIKRRMKEARK